jgi:hypothetical protein
MTRTENQFQPERYYGEGINKCSCSRNIQASTHKPRAKKKFSARTRSIPPEPAQAAEEKNVVTPCSRAMVIKSEIWLQHAQENRQRHEACGSSEKKQRLRMKHSDSKIVQIQKKKTPQMRSKNYFYCNLKKDCNRFTEVIILPPLFDYWNMKFSTWLTPNLRYSK